MSALSAIFVLKENGTQSHSAKFLYWGDHVNSVPDLLASPPGNINSSTLRGTLNYKIKVSYNAFKTHMV